jgi:ABC-type glycerol-3-phosphate transport system substrate-binding protein
MAVSRRDFLGYGGGALVTALLAPALAACGSSTSGGTVKSGKVRLSLWVQDPGLAADLQRTAAHLTKPYQYTTSTVVQDSSDLITKSLAAYTAHGQVPDILGVDISLWSKFMTSDLAAAYLLDITDRVKSIRQEFYESRWIAYADQSQLYGVESNFPLTPYYKRTDLFDQYKVPEIMTWDDFLRVGAAVHSKHGVYLGAMGQTNGTDLTWFGLFFQQRGGTFFTESGDIAIDSPEAVEALQLMIDLVKNNCYQLVSNFYGGAGTAAIAQNKVIGNYMPSWYESIISSGNANQKGKWAITLPPRFSEGGHISGVWGGTGWVVSKTSANSEAAWNLLYNTRLTLDGQVANFKDSHFLPTMKKAYTDPRITSYGDPFLGGQQTIPIYSKIATDSPAQYQSPRWAEMTNALAPEVDKALLGQQSASAAIKNAMATYKSNA